MLGSRRQKLYQSASFKVPTPGAERELTAAASPVGRNILPQRLWRCDKLNNSRSLPRKLRLRDALHGNNYTTASINSKSGIRKEKRNSHSVPQT